MSANVPFVASFLLIMSWVEKESAKFFVHSFGDDNEDTIWMSLWLLYPPMQKRIFIASFSVVWFIESAILQVWQDQKWLLKEKCRCLPNAQSDVLVFLSDMFDYMVEWTEVLGQRYRKINKYNYTYIHTYIRKYNSSCPKCMKGIFEG